MLDILEWIKNNPIESFVIGFFIYYCIKAARGSNDV